MLYLFRLKTFAKIECGNANIGSDLRPEGLKLIFSFFTREREKAFFGMGQLSGLIREAIIGVD